MSEWQPIETAPSGLPVLVYYLNQLGKGRSVKAMYADRFAIESQCDDEYVEYSEEADEYYMPEGWYECIDNWDEYSFVSITEGTPTHWMPIPEPPK